MSVRRSWFACGAALCVMTTIASLDGAQGSVPAAQASQGGPDAGAQGRGDGRGGRGAFVPEPVPPPQNFRTSTEHYEHLLRIHNGGTKHTHASIPQWEGLWSAAGNTSTTLFLKGGAGPQASAEIIPGVLTPAYEAAFKMRRSLGAEYDRLTRCEPAGYPRWLLEPYVREFVNTPTQSWWMNDLANDTRRIYIDQPHRNIDGTHSPEGDSVGFWSGDTLVVHTVDIYPNDYFRGQPPTSNQFESVEVWRMVTLANGEPRLNVNVTFYDPLSLVQPVTAVYTFRRNTELESAGYRIRHWECESNENSYLVLDPKGRPSTQFRLPGDAGFDDVRGVDPNRNPDLPRDLPGQSRSPDGDTPLK